jgi:peptide/nickel transport system substrate-binding protein
MSSKRTTWRLAGAVAFGLLVAVAIASAALARSSSTKASEIIDGTTDTVTNVDPAGNYDYGTFTVDILIYQHLLDFRPGSTIPSPALATGCSPNRALTVWSCSLKRGVRFSNGDAFTSTDVKWSFDRVLKIKDPSGIDSLLSNLASTTTAGPYKVLFHLKTAQSTWPYILTTGAATIVDHNTYPANKLVPNSDTHDLVGTGPYVLSKFTPGQQAVFTPNHLSNLKARNGGVIITYYSKSSTMKLALQQGTVDMAFRAFTPTELNSLSTASGITVYKGHGSEIRYLVFNVKQAPTNNPAVRRAIAYLFPRQDIASRIYHGQVEPLYTMVPGGLPGHIDAFKSVYGGSPSVAKAKAVLAKAGVKTPIALTVWWTPTHYGDASADEYTEIQRALNASGLFKVTLKSAEWATYVDTLGKQYGTFQLGWFPDYPDAEDYLVPFYATGNFLSNGYSSKAMDAILTKEKASRTTAQRMGYVRQAQMLAAKDVPIIPYFQASMIAVAHKSVHGIPATLDPAFIMRFWTLTKS